MNKSVSFLASFPPIQSAIKIFGHKNGMRIQLDVPETEMGNAVNVLAWRECVLKITIEPMDDARRSKGKSRKIHI